MGQILKLSPLLLPENKHIKQSKDKHDRTI